MIVVFAVRFDLVPALRGPAPYPPEWQWRHRPRALHRILPALPIGAAFVGLLAWSGSAAARRRPGRGAAVVLGGALVLGWVYPLALLESEDGGAVAHLVRRTASPGYLSYHAVASSADARDVSVLLRDYPRLLPTFPIHAATHPPVPVLAFRALEVLVDTQPALQRRLDGVIAAACGVPADGCGPHVAALAPTGRATALLGALLAHALAVATLLPIAWLAFALTRDPLAAARSAALWPLVPGAALFVPALDPAVALPITTALAGLRLATTGERSWTRAAGAGITSAAGAVALYLSYGSALFLVLGAGVVLASLPPGQLVYRRARITATLAAVGIAGLAFAAAPLALGHDPLASARAALRIHADTYTARRSYPLWLVFGPIDLAVFLGAPIVVGFAAHLAGAARAGRTSVAANPPARLALATAAAFGLLFASGLVRGEVGRLLVPLLPLGLLAGTLRLERDPGPDAGTATVTAALLAAIDAVMRLNGRI